MSASSVRRLRRGLLPPPPPPPLQRRGREGHSGRLGWIPRCVLPGRGLLAESSPPLPSTAVLRASMSSPSPSQPKTSDPSGPLSPAHQPGRLWRLLQGGFSRLMAQKHLLLRCALLQEAAPPVPPARRVLRRRGSPGRLSLGGLSRCKTAIRAQRPQLPSAMPWCVSPPALRTTDVMPTSEPYQYDACRSEPETARAS